MSAPRPVRRWKEHRPAINRAAKRYFVYQLLGADGTPIYIGRSCNVAARIRAHVSDAEHQFSAAATRKALWLIDVRSVTMCGPFTWDEAVKEERRQIEENQPWGNLDLTARDHRPMAAARSIARAKAVQR